MELNKEQKKQLENVIRNKAREKGYKKRDFAIYKKKNYAFIHCFFFIRSQDFSYRIYIKNYDYDDIFWKIMQMPENSKESDSLRAVGAFRSPSIELKKDILEYTEDLDGLADYLLEMTERCSCNFIKRYEDIDKYIIEYNDDVYNDVYHNAYNNAYIGELRCIAFLHMGKSEEARKLAQAYIDKGERGGFSNKGISFYEGVLLEAQNGAKSKEKCEKKNEIENITDVSSVSETQKTYGKLISVKANMCMRLRALLFWLRF